MGALNELYVIRHSFSADRQIQYQSRSGDASGVGATVLDLVVSVQSAEADIIEREEREEQAESKRKFTKLLLTYYKRLLTVTEFKFLIACMRENKTPYRIGLSMGLNYRTLFESIRQKHEANLDKLTAFMLACGYDYRHGLDFMPDLQRCIRIYERQRKYRTANREKILQYKNNYAQEHREEISQRHKAYCAANKEKILQSRQKRREKIIETNRNYWQKHREEISQRRKAHYYANREEINAKRRMQRRLKKEAQERAEGV